jgi:hypothetical protein
MTAEDYFIEFMSGEPLTQEAVIEGLTEYARIMIDEYTNDIQSEIEDAINTSYKNIRP